MPAKRRKSKRRLDPHAEMAAWACMFACGSDFFGGIGELGFATEAEARAAMPEAWARLGRLFLERRQEFGFGVSDYALRELGEPGHAG